MTSTYTPDGVRVDTNPVPLADRLSWTIPEAAAVWGISYETLRLAVRNNDVDTFRPPSERGTPGRRHVTREEMKRWIDSLEQA